MPASIVTLFYLLLPLTCGAQWSGGSWTLGSVETLAKEFPLWDLEHLNLTETKFVGMRSSNSASGSFRVMVEQGQIYIT